MTELWNWRIDGARPVEVYPALAEALGRVVMPLAVADPARLPDVRGGLRRLAGAGRVRHGAWTATGCPSSCPSCRGVAALARLLGRNCLLRDDTLDAGRHLLVAPDGTIRPVHFDVRDTDDGEVLTDQRLCTAGRPGLPGLVAVPPLALGPGLGRPGARRRLSRPGPAPPPVPGPRRSAAAAAGRSAGRRPHHQLVQQGRGGRGHGVHRGVERGGVVRGRRRKPEIFRTYCNAAASTSASGHLRGVRLAQGLDAAAHGSSSVRSGLGSARIRCPRVMTTAAAGSPRTYQVRTYGCQMNVHDSERISGLLERPATCVPPRPTTPDVVVFNTCAVRENADNRLYGNLGHLRPVKAPHPGMQIAVGGCLAQKDRGDIVRRAPWVDVVFGTHNIGSLPVLLERARHNAAAEVEILESLDVFPSTLPTRRESTYAGWVSISVGARTRRAAARRRSATRAYVSEDRPEATSPGVANLDVLPTDRRRRFRAYRESTPGRRVPREHGSGSGKTRGTQADRVVARGTFGAIWPLALIVLGSVELNLAEHRPTEVGQDLDLLGRPVPRLMIDGAQGAEHVAGGGDERDPGIGDDPQIADGRVVTEQRVFAGVGDHEGATGLDHVLAEGVREGSLPLGRPGLR